MHPKEDAGTSPFVKTCCASASLRQWFTLSDPAMGGAALTWRCSASSRA
jgi:hypothetical protein